MNNSGSAMLSSSSSSSSSSPPSSPKSSSIGVFLSQRDAEATLRDWESRFRPRTSSSRRRDSSVTPEDIKVSHEVSTVVTNDEEEHPQGGGDGSGSASFMPKSFPEVLKDILSDESNSDSIAWLPHGKSFMVLNRKKFVDHILPRYLCKATKYTSFTRKLSRWNFTRIANGPDEGAWYNKCFIRDDENQTLLREMKCAKRKKPNSSFRSSNNRKQNPEKHETSFEQEHSQKSRSESPLHVPSNDQQVEARDEESRPQQDQAESLPRTRPLKKRPVDASLFRESKKQRRFIHPTSPVPPSSSGEGSWQTQLERQIEKQKMELEVTKQMLEEQQKRHQQLLQLKSPDLSLRSLANRYRFEPPSTTRTVVTAAMQALLQSTNSSPLQLLGGLGINLTPQQQSTILTRSLLRGSSGDTGYNVLNTLQAAHLSLEQEKSLTTTTGNK